MTGSVIVGDTTAPKPWMVMVHGMSQDHRIFGAQVDAFGSDYRILLVDLPGHGLSAGVDGPYGHAEFADHVRRVMAASEVERSIFWGTHTGATVGLLLAAREPWLISSLILEGPLVPGEAPPVVREAIGRARRIASDEDVGAAVEDWWLTAPWFGAMRANPGRSRADAHRAIVRDFGAKPWTDPRPGRAVTGVEAALAKIQAPALIYNGAADHADFFDAAARVDRLLPAARTTVIPDSGGFPAWENPEAVAAMVRGFLK
jgi:pimeloyl-ACP methyl ester carboxylesterase